MDIRFDREVCSVAAYVGFGCEINAEISLSWFYVP